MAMKIVCPECGSEELKYEFLVVHRNTLEYNEEKRRNKL